MITRDLAPFYDLVKDGYLSMQRLDVPRRDTRGIRRLVLFNYTDKCTYDRHWNEYTLRSRGTVYDEDTGDVVARTFDKFFNDSELQYKLPEGPHVVYEKLDGSLGNVFWDGRQWRVTTRGSFASKQAERAMQMLVNYNMGAVPQNVSLSVEIIFPFNEGPLLHYGDREDLTILAAFDNDSGRELTRAEVEVLGIETRMPVVKTVVAHIAVLQENAKTAPAIVEGWVVYWPFTGERVKVKLAEYLRLAKFKANLGPIAIWEAMDGDTIDEFLQRCPEELLPEAEEIVAMFRDQHHHLRVLFTGAIHRLGLPCGARAMSGEGLKEWALQINKEPQWLRQHLFAYLRKGTPFNGLRHLYPKGNEFVDLTVVITGVAA